MLMAGPHDPGQRTRRQPRRQDRVQSNSEGDSDSASSSAKKDRQDAEEASALARFLEQDTVASNSAVQMDKLLFQDEHTATEYIKGLISASTLEGAWAKLCRRVHYLDTSVKSIKNFLSPQVMESKYVTAPVYKAQVSSYDSTLSSQEQRLKVQETSAQALAEAQADIKAVQSQAGKEIQVHGEQLKELQEGFRQLQEEMNQQLGMLKQQQAEIRQEVQMLEAKREIITQTLETRLEKTVVVQQQLQEDVKSQEVKWDPSNLQKQLTNVLDNFDFDEGSTSSSNFGRALGQIAHVDEVMKKFREGMDVKLEEMETDIRVCKRDLASTAFRMEEKTSFNDERIVKILETISELATRAEFDRLGTDVALKFKAEFDFVSEVKQASIGKFHELIQRLGELQILIEDHEHALQHQAEEIQNRATKYDVAICTQRVELCAPKERVDSELAYLKSQVQWQTSKIEGFTFDKNFGDGKKSTSSLAHSLSSLMGAKASRQGSVACLALAGALGRGGSVANLGALGGLSSSSTSFKFGMPKRSESRDFGSPKRSQSREIGAPGRDDSLSNKSGESAVSVSAHLGGLGAMEAASSDSEGHSHQKSGEVPHHSDDESADYLDLTPEAQAALARLQEEALAEQLALLGEHMEQSTDRVMNAGTEEIYQVQRQLKSLAEILLGIASVTLKSTFLSQPKAIREKKCSQLLEHTGAVLHWVTHQVTPAQWDPSQLTTLALVNLMKLDFPPDRSPKKEGLTSRRIARARRQRAALRASAAYGPSPNDSDTTAFNSPGPSSGWRSSWHSPLEGESPWPDQALRAPGRLQNRTQASQEELPLVIRGGGLPMLTQLTAPCSAPCSGQGSLDLPEVHPPPRPATRADGQVRPSRLARQIVGLGRKPPTIEDFSGGGQQDRITGEIKSSDSAVDDGDERDNFSLPPLVAGNDDD